jgi:hypothetical protein
LQKIPTLFVRDPADRQFVTDTVNPGCEWVLEGEGVATRKYDGTCCMLDNSGVWWARREVKPGKKPPAGYLPVETDPVTGKTVGWEPITQSSFAKFHAEAVRDAEDAEYPDGVYPGPWPVGTYELIGPKVNGNPERCETHELVAHEKAAVISMPDRITYSTLRELFHMALAPLGFEGLVWHHPDGRFAKLKVRDFPQVPTHEGKQ